ncbi:MAG: adenylate/guanylate cyclase domain-containing protein, partial [Acidimicrobiales bacterium]
MHCVSCGSVLPAGARFCPSCGHRVEHRHDERRIVTVVFVDIVGFTALSEQADPEQVKNLVDDVFERLAGDITGFGGRVDKVLGDGILAIFGAPIAHEDDAERAVRAALAMQETVGVFNNEFELDLAIRIGVNTGEVLVGEIRAAGDYTAMGDAVNIASRLSGLALPGQVVAGNDTYLATEIAVSYQAQGQMQLAGRSEPVATWIALAAVGLPGKRVRRRGDMIGRDTELSVALQSIESAFRSERSLFMLVLGEAGVGKSRLAEEVASNAEKSGAVVLAGRCVPYGEANIWFPIAEAVKTALDLDGRINEDPAVASVQLSDAVIGLVGANAFETVRIVNGLLFLLDISGPLDRIEPKRAQDEAARSARMSLEALADRRPVFLRLVDLHWADVLVLEMVNDIIERMAHKPFVMMATARFGLSERWTPRPGRHNTVTFTLDPLDPGAAAKLATRLLPEATAELRAELVDRSGGNPFFLEELATLIDTDGIAGAAALPGTIRGLIAARLDRLDSAATGVVEDAAVLGSRGITVALERMAEARGVEGPIRSLIVRLVDADVLEVDHQAGIWSFHSDLVRDVVYQRLTKSDRSVRHFGVANYIEHTYATSATSAVIAHHYRRAAELDREMGGVREVPSDVADRAIEWIGRAASETMATERWDTAVTLWGQMLALLS